ncbi:arginine--tRNA ligase [Alphaproteobacteria bacterium]|nr:arginine--tRNA ligase [Alphaproteobacteria bacterium]
MEKIVEAIRTAVQAEFGIDVTPTISVPDGDFGDYATNVAMQIAGRVGDSPRSIAEKIAQRLDYEANVAGPGFINIRLSDADVANELNNFLAQPDSYGVSKAYDKKVVVTEFSDPNPFKVLHIGHLYTSVVGDAISRLIEAAGGAVHRVNFGGDVGLHVAKNMWAIIQNLGSENPEKLDDVPEAERPDWLAARYVEGNGAYGADDQAKLEIVELNKKVYQLFADDDHDTPFAQIYWMARQWSYDYFDRFYEKIGVEFEKYYPESEGAKIGLPIVREQTKNGVYRESNGAIIFDGEPYGLHTRVFVNSEGLPTYETKDLGCNFQKWDEYHFDQSIIITGNDIVDYMRVLMKSIEQFQPEIAERTLHLTHGNVKLSGGVKMSSRLGNFLKAEDVLTMTEQAIAAEQGSSDPDLVLGAIKYAFLRSRLGPDTIYEPETSVSLRGNSGPYLQYAVARAKSILRKLNTNVGMSVPAEQDFDEYERALTMKLLSYGDVVAQATAELAPHIICTYLYELAQVFNRFYENAKVEGNPRQALRTQLVYLYMTTMSRGLNLLGIPVMEKM